MVRVAGKLVAVERLYVCLVVVERSHEVNAE